MWEYRVMADSWTFNTSEQAQKEMQEATQKLNMEGQQDWELTSVQSISTADRRVAFIYFYKRPKK